MPYADDAMLLLVVFLAFGVVIVEALGTVERPPRLGAPSLLPMAIPVAVAAYFVVHWDRYSPILIPYSLAYGYVALALRGPGAAGGRPGLCRHPAGRRRTGRQDPLPHLRQP
jgi:hypothetical protein